MAGFGPGFVRCAAQSDTIVEAMQKLSLPVTYIVFLNEGHGFNSSNPRTTSRSQKRSTVFLCRYLHSTCP